MQEVSFGKLLCATIRSADRRLANRGGVARKYGISPVGVDMVCSILSEGWDAFEELADRIKEGYFLWTTGIDALFGVATLPTVIAGAAMGKVGKSLSFWGGDEKAVRNMYDNKNLIVAVHRIGQSKFSEFTKYQNDEGRLQRLKEEIVQELVNKKN